MGRSTHGSLNVTVSRHGQFVAKAFCQHSKSLFGCVVHFVTRIYRIRVACYADIVKKNKSRTQFIKKINLYVLSMDLK